MTGVLQRRTSCQALSPRPCLPLTAQVPEELEPAILHMVHHATVSQLDLLAARVSQMLYEPGRGEPPKLMERLFDSLRQTHLSPATYRCKQEEHAWRCNRWATTWLGTGHASPVHHVPACIYPQGIFDMKPTPAIFLSTTRHPSIYATLGTWRNPTWDWQDSG